MILECCLQMSGSTHHFIGFAAGVVLLQTIAEQMLAGPRR
jgi:hypothetical protein